MTVNAPVIVLPWHVHMRAMIKIQYTSTDSNRLPVRVCAMFEGLGEFRFIFPFRFRASLLNFTSQIERLHDCYYCAYICSVLAYFCNEYTRERPSTGRSGQIIDNVCMSQFL